MLTSSTLQRKEGTLGIGTSRDPATVLQFDRTLENPASAIIDALGGHADVVDIEVIEPTRLRHARKDASSGMKTNCGGFGISQTRVKRCSTAWLRRALTGNS